jgi:hypothetical protein
MPAAKPEIIVEETQMKHNRDAASALLKASAPGVSDRLRTYAGVVEMIATRRDRLAH